MGYIPGTRPGGAGQMQGPASLPGSTEMMVLTSSGVIQTQTIISGELVDDTTPQLGGTLDANTFDIDMGVNTITDTKVGQWDTAYGWGDHGSAGYITDLVSDTTPQLGGTLDANSNTIDMGLNVITDTKVGQWDTAYGWGDHGSAGYITDLVSDTTPQLGGTLDANSYGIDMGLNTITDTKVGQWDTAHGWGDHATAGYITDLVSDTTPQLGGTLDANGNTIDMGVNVITDAKVTEWNAAFIWGDHSSAGYLTSFDLVDDTTPQLGGTLDANANIIDMGLNTITDTKVGQWDTAYGWGDHGSEGYITELFDDTSPSLGGALVTNGYNIVTGVNQITDTKVGNWDTAYGWGDHGSAGYITDLVSDTTPQLGGTLDANGKSIDMGFNTITDAKVGEWNTAYSWGAHSLAGYALSDTDETFTKVTVTQQTADGGYEITGPNDTTSNQFSASNYSATEYFTVGPFGGANTNYQLTVGVSGNKVQIISQNASPYCGFLIDSTGEAYMDVQRGSTSYWGRFLFRTGGTSKYSLGLRNNSTDEFHLYSHVTGDSAFVANSTGDGVEAEMPWIFPAAGLRVATHTPSSASDTGVTGSIAWDSSYLYICTATDTWKRVAISTW